MRNIFCVDLEDWFHQSLVPQANINFKPTVERNTDRLLEIFSDYNTKATFFTLGDIAENHSALIKKIAAQGHEIACHSYSHRLIYDMSPEQFREDTRKSKEILEEISDTKIYGYRAPSWSVNKSTLWALDILQELGFTYDSSIFPVHNFLYGIPGADRFPHEMLVNGKPFLELPPSTFTFAGKNMGFSGGFYMRMLPGFIIKHFTKMTNNEGHPVLFYLHPHEIDTKTPKFKVNMRDDIISNWGKRHCEKKLIGILKDYSCTTIIDYIKEEIDYGNHKKA